MKCLKIMPKRGTVLVGLQVLDVEEVLQDVQPAVVEVMDVDVVVVLARL